MLTCVTQFYVYIKRNLIIFRQKLNFLNKLSRPSIHITNKMLKCHKFSHFLHTPKKFSFILSTSWLLHVSKEIFDPFFSFVLSFQVCQIVRIHRRIEKAAYQSTAMSKQNSWKYVIRHSRRMLKQHYVCHLLTRMTGRTMKYYI